MTSSVELGGKYSTAHSARTGEPCRAHPVHEATVCYWHGGASPQVKKAAARRTGVVTHFQRLGQTRPLRDLGDQSRTYSPQAGKPSSVKGDVLLASALGTQDLRSIFAGTWQSWSKMEQQRYCLLPGSSPSLLAMAKEVADPQAIFDPTGQVLDSAGWLLLGNALCHYLTFD